MSSAESPAPMTPESSVPGEPTAEQTEPTLEPVDTAGSDSDSEGDRFELVAMQLDGKPIDVGARQTVRVIDFWASWCKPCVRQMPQIVELQRRYADRGVEVFAVGIDEDKAVLERALAEHGFGDGPTFLWDPAGEASKPYISFFGMRALPRTLVVDAGGRIVARHRGSDTALQDLGEDLDALLAEAQPQRAEP